MATVLDTTWDCSRVIECLKQSGYDTVVRYYSRSDWKRLSQAEATALGRAGMRLAVVYQNRQNQPADFTAAAGEAAGRAVDDYARNVIFQPAGSAIYFSVDFDAGAREIESNVIPFFQGVARGLSTSAGGTADYLVGVYGSGRVCRTIVDAGLAQFAWLAQSRGWSEYQNYLAGRQWHLKQNMPATVCGLDCDPDETNPDRPDFGSFLLDPDSMGQGIAPRPAPVTAARFVVNARGGLRLRSGPSTDFDVRSVLSAGTTVWLLSRTGEWALVDLNGDGLADGYCYASFLRPL